MWHLQCALLLLPNMYTRRYCVAVLVPADLDGTTGDADEVAIVLHRVCDVMGGAIKPGSTAKASVTIKRETIRCATHLQR